MPIFFTSSIERPELLSRRLKKEVKSAWHRFLTLLAEDAPVAPGLLGLVKSPIGLGDHLLPVVDVYAGIGGHSLADGHLQSGLGPHERGLLHRPPDPLGRLIGLGPVGLGK